MDKIWIMGPDAGDIFDLGREAEKGLILPGFQSWDVGLILNEKDGTEFWRPFEIMQFHGFVRGVEIWIEVAGGRMGWNGQNRYRVAFGPRPNYPEKVDVYEASRLIKENVPPQEYVRVTPEEWAHRRDGA